MVAVWAVIGGCVCTPLDDDSAAPDDDTAVADDDSIPADDDTAVPVAPAVIITGLLDEAGNPATLPLHGLVTVTYWLDDPDSEGYSVALRYGVTGPPGTLFPATVVNATTAPNIFTESVPGAPPLGDHPGALLWDSTTDVPIYSSQGILDLCPTDSEGNEGECVVFPEPGDLVINNFDPSDYGQLPEPGDMEDNVWTGGEAIVPLTDGSFDTSQISDPSDPSDFSAQYLLVLVNPNPDPVGLSIVSLSSLPLSPPPPRPADRKVTSLRPPSAPAIPSPLPPPCGPYPPLLDAGDLHTGSSAVSVIDSLLQPRTVESASLEALSDHVAIWVDEETPMNWDSDCLDPWNSIELHDVPAGGFDNCALETFTELIESNIWPVVTGTYGAPSDVDQDGRVNVLITLRQNHLALQDGDEDNDDVLLAGLSEPEVDLWAYDGILNPGSNEGEWIYLAAPDPLGLWSDHLLPVDEAMDLVLPAAFATELARLISAAHHRDICDTPLDPDQASLAPPPAEDWLEDGLSMLAADLCGFGAASWEEVWTFLDRSPLLPLWGSDEILDPYDRGGAWLLARYVVDQYGVGILPWLIDGGPNDLPSLISADYASWEDFLLTWATAVATSGMEDPQSPGDPLVPASELPPFLPPTTVVVTGLPGDLIGANGYPQGFGLRGLNPWVLDGLNAAGGTPVPERAVRAENFDVLPFHPYADFYTQIAGEGGIAAVLISRIDDEQAYLFLETSGGEDLLGRVVRLEDVAPTAFPLTLEDVFSALPTYVRPLGALDPGGAERRVIGVIDGPQTLWAVPLHGGPVSSLMVDTDRYGFSLLAPTRVAAWIDRRYDDLAGTVPLDDVWLAVMRQSDLPDAFDYARWNAGPMGYPCSDPSIYQYPAVIPDFIVAQGVLIPDPVVSAVLPTPVTGGPTSTLTCAVDFDQDGVADVDEAMPATFAEQIRQHQAENLANDAAFYAGTWSTLPSPWTAPDPTAPFFLSDGIDLDSNEVPDDERARADLVANAGGRSVAGGEEALWEGMLPAGDWVVVVGGVGGAEGPYDLSVRVLP